MEYIVNGIIESLKDVGIAFVHNWPYLVISVLVSVILKLYVSTDKVSEYLLKHQNAGVLTATLAAVLTPFCSCGTTAVVLGMMASTIPWGPVVAFMVSSPLSSPEELIYSAGLFGWPFAIALFASSILLGLCGGWIASRLESMDWLRGQNRFMGVISKPENSCVCSTGFASKPLRLEPAEPRTPILSQMRMVQVEASCCGSSLVERTESTVPACGCGSSSKQMQRESNRPAVGEFFAETGKVGLRLLWMFGAFAFIGYFLNNLIPSTWMEAIFGSQQAYSVPLAATLGLPFYINGEASLPLLRAMIDNGMNQGAALAFLIAGAGTSIGAISGALTIARWKVVAIVIGTLWIGAMIAGMIYNLVFSLGVF